MEHVRIVTEIKSAYVRMVGAYILILVHAPATTIIAGVMLLTLKPLFVMEMANANALLVHARIL